MTEMRELPDYFFIDDEELDETKIRTQLRNLLTAAGTAAARKLIEAIDEGRVDGGASALDRNGVGDGCGCAIAHLFQIRTLSRFRIEDYRECATNPYCDPRITPTRHEMLDIEKFIYNINAGEYASDNPELAWLRVETEAWLKEREDANGN